MDLFRRKEEGRERGGKRTYWAVFHDDITLLGSAFDDMIVEADYEGVAQVLEDVHLRGRGRGREGEGGRSG